MELSFRELKKRDVVNVADGRCLGNIIDLSLDFPDGELSGIVVPGRRCGGIARLFDKTEIYVDVTRIIKIGNDVILVDLGCENGGKRPRPKPLRPPQNQPQRPPRPNNCGLPNCEDILNSVRNDGEYESDY